ncbi:hypothetical protein DID78_07055 [Candidatus Marinamargulisbacteria bacterium SCGC AG-343-D04]|nr:hypothetical protein DID78_07055 [Candidatus Marinamargulisbacteria bacterium SCGC AG-343-D04]
MEESSPKIKPVDLVNNANYDVIIIGGGINGASIARDAALRGLSVCLLEKNDFGSGSSSKSSKLAHGGLRYLEHLEFRLVQETLRERDTLLKCASKYVTPLKFLYPVYSFSKRPLWKIRLGMWVYSLLTFQSDMPSYSMLSKNTIKKECPTLRQDCLKGGATYYDGQMQDFNLIIANISDAKAHGAHTFENCTVSNFIKDHDKVVGVEVQKDEKSLYIYGQCVVNATGAWSNETAGKDKKLKTPLVAPTKGVHIVVRSLGLDQALILETPQDNRIFFIIPWENKTLIGTTDTAFEGSLDNIVADDADITYLLTASNHYLKDIVLKKEDVIDTFAALRPLQYSEKGASKRSRDFSLVESDSELIHLFGGKYTSYRYMAECTVDHIINKLPFRKEFRKCITAIKPLP